MTILINPIITEKATIDSEKFNRYAFSVHPKANKIQIKEAVEAAYDVSVAKVRTMNVRPDRTIRHTKTGIQAGKTNAVKKAVVQLVDGDIIDFYTNL